MYDQQGVTYLFDLDYVVDEFTVDAAHYGNVSHFINHSVSINDNDQSSDITFLYYYFLNLLIKSFPFHKSIIIY